MRSSLPYYTTCTRTRARRIRCDIVLQAIERVLRPFNNNLPNNDKKDVNNNHEKKRPSLVTIIITSDVLKKYLAFLPQGLLCLMITVQ